MTLDADRRATLAVAAQFAINGAFGATFIPRLPELRDAVDISTPAIGLVLTVAGCAGVLGSAVTNRVIAMFGTRRVLFFGGVLMAISLVAVGRSTTWPVLLIALAALFALDVAVDVAMNMQASRLSAQRALTKRPIMSRIHGLWSLGSVAGGSVAAQSVNASVALTTHLMVVAVALAIASSLASLWLLPVDQAHAEAEAEPELDLHADESGRRSRHGAFLFAGFAAIAIEMTAQNWAPFRITDDLGGADSTAALTFAGVMTGMTVARFAGDHLIMLLGTRRFTSGSAVLAVFGLVVASLVDSSGVAVVGFFVAGLGVATLAPQLYDQAARAGAGTASRLGPLSAGMRLAAVVSPVAVGWLAGAASVGVAIAVASVVFGCVFLASTDGRLSGLVTNRVRPRSPRDRRN